VLAAVVGLGFVGAAAVVVSNEVFQFRDDSRAWPRSGAPCPMIAPDAVARTLALHGLSVRYRVDVGGAEFGRAFGDGDCGMAPSGVGWSYAPACRFEAPALVTVRTTHGETYFLTGLGRAVTAFAGADGAHCYLAPVAGAATS
jgi:hypothetical protein